MGATLIARTVHVAVTRATAVGTIRTVMVIVRRRRSDVAVATTRTTVIARVVVTVAHAAPVSAGSDGCSIVMVAIVVTATARAATRSGSGRRSISARIPTIVVMVVIGVMMRIRRRKRTRAGAGARTRNRRRHRRHETVIVEAIVSRPGVETWTRRQNRYDPGGITRAVPREADWLKVLERGEGEQVFAHLIIRHNRINDGRIQTIGHDIERDSLDLAGADLDTFVGIFGAVIRIEIDADISLIGNISDILHVVADRDRVIVIHYHGL